MHITVRAGTWTSPLQAVWRPALHAEVLRELDNRAHGQA